MIEDAFEKDLREQLRTREAPGGFADRVMTRVAAKPARRRWPGFGMPVWRWAVAALLVAGMVLGSVEHDREQRREGERAREQVLLALRITGATLRDVQEKVDAESGQETRKQSGGMDREGQAQE